MRQQEVAKRAFVTGATGFLGINLVEQLCHEGWQVTALYRDAGKVEPLKKFGVDLVQGSIEDQAHLVPVMPKNLDAVFHVAAEVSFWHGYNERQTKTNVEGTRNVVEAAIKNGAHRFVHTSSIAVYGFQPGIITEESAQLGLNSWINYLKTKALAEEEVRKGIKAGLDAVILNPANIVGPHDPHNWGRSFRLIKENKLPGIPPGRGNFAHGVEVAKAHIVASEKGRTGHNYLLGGPTASYMDCLKIVAKLLDVPLRTTLVPGPILKGLALVSDFGSRFTKRAPEITPEMAEALTAVQLCSSAKAEKELAYKTVPIEQSFADCYQSLVEEGLLPASIA